MVSRRTMLKAAVSAILCRTVSLRDEVPDERLLRLFCDTDRWSGPLHQPFSIGSLTYGTDARCIVRAELPNVVELGSQRLPPAAEVFQRCWISSANWRPLESFDLSSSDARHFGWGSCPQCESQRTVKVKPPEICFDDDGVPTGELKELDRYGLDCDTWKIRDKNCPTCHGLEYTGQGAAELFGHDFDLNYLRKIAKLPNPMVHLSYLGDEKPSRAVLLVSAGPFQGVCASMNLRTKVD